MYAVAAKAREKVIAFEGFTQGFLHGFRPNPAPGSHLGMLLLDNETTLGLQKIIAEFAGVPDESDVGRLRLASLNLLFFVRYR